MKSSNLLCYQILLTGKFFLYTTATLILVLQNIKRTNEVFFQPVISTNMLDNFGSVTFKIKIRQCYVGIYKDNKKRLCTDHFRHFLRRNLQQIFDLRNVGAWRLVQFAAFRLSL